MKMFEEKFDVQARIPEKNQDYYINERISLVKYLGQKEGWRKALEYVLEIYEELEMKDWGYIACEIEERIKKELNKQ